MHIVYKLHYHSIYTDVYNQSIGEITHEKVKLQQSTSVEETPQDILEKLPKEELNEVCMYGNAVCFAKNKFITKCSVKCSGKVATGTALLL